MLYLEFAVIFYGTNNINKDLHFDIAECYIETGKHFGERPFNDKIVIFGILSRD